MGLTCCLWPHFPGHVRGRPHLFRAQRDQYSAVPAKLKLNIKMHKAISVIQFKVEGHGKGASEFPIGKQEPASSGGLRDWQHLSEWHGIW